MIGVVAGNYKLVDKIGEGGMGSVYRGIDMMLEREVAIKVLRPELARQPDIVERFRVEAVTLAKLNHPNIATLFSFFRQGDDYFMVMEFVRGETLENRIRRMGPMDPTTAIPIFCQALEGIEHAHRMGIIHRDIKPANMMLTQSGSIKVMDFGIARVLGTARMTKQGSVIGTIEYMSPEQVMGQETDGRSDIYSLGILLYEMLTGRVPFTGTSDYQLMQCQIQMPPTPPRVFAANIPPPIELAIMRALSKNPADRPQTAAEFRQILVDGMSFSMGDTRRVPMQSTVAETRVPPQGQPWPGAYGYQPVSQGAQGGGAYPGPGIQAGPSGWAGSGGGFQADAASPGVAQPAYDYWQNAGQMPVGPQSAVTAKKKWTWKHYFGLVMALCLLAGVPFAIWVIVQLTAPPTAATFIERGDKLSAARKWNEAEAEYRHAAALQPSDEATEFKTYVTLVRQNKNAEALEAYRKIDQNSEWPRIESYFRNALARQPNNGDYHQYLSIALSCQKKYAEAEQSIRRAVQVDPNYAPYHNTLAATLDDLNKAADAESEYRQSIKLDPRITGPHLGLASLLYRQRKYPAAEANYKDAVAIDSGFAPAHLGLGITLQAEQKTADAERELREAIRLDPQNSRAHSSLASVLKDRKQWAEAGSEYRESIRIDPKDAEDHAGLGFCLYQLKRYIDAEAEYRDAVQLDPKNAVLHYELGLCLNDDEKYAEAESEYRESIRLDPNASYAHNNLGVTLERQGNTLAAEEEYRQAVRLDPSNSVAQNNLNRLAGQFPFFNQQ